MIRTLSCDRCHTEFEPYTPQNNETLTLQVETEEEKFDVDLCPKCYEELNKWWQQ